VVLGAAHASERDLHMAALLDQGFTIMDVPPVNREPQVASRMPSIIGSAHAATMPPPRPPPAKWAVQIGAYPSETAARQAAAAARKLVDAGEVHTEAVNLHGKTNWRAQLIGLGQAEARDTCATLAKHKLSCMPLRPDPGQLASG